MIDLLIDGAIQGAFGSRRKKSKNALRYLTGGNSWMRNPNVLLTAAGLAWGVYESLNQPKPQMPAGQVPPLPPGPVPDDALRIVRLAVSAAHAESGRASCRGRGS
jgi:hypothetical protein